MPKRKGTGGTGARQPVEYSKLWSYPRHPNFDAMWAKYERLVWWWARRMAWIANRAEGRFSRRRHCRFYWDGRDFVGLLTIRLNRLLYDWVDEGGCAFTTYFSSYTLVEECMRYVVKLDRDRGTRDEEQQRAALEAYAYERGQRYHLYRTPEDGEWEEQMLELMGDDPWANLMLGLPPRSRTIMEWRFRDGKTLQEVGDLLGLSKERVRQVENQSLSAIRRRIEKYEPARRLFFGEAA